MSFVVDVEGIFSTRNLLYYLYDVNLTIVKEKHQHHLKKLVTWAEREMDANILLSAETKEKIKKL